MATQQTEKCQGHEHPEPAKGEYQQMHAALVAAAKAVDKAWGLANRTPSYHWLTDELGPMGAELIRLCRIA